MWVLLPLLGELPPAMADTLDACLLTLISAPILWWLVVQTFRTIAMCRPGRGVESP